MHMNVKNRKDKSLYQLDGDEGQLELDSNKIISGAVAGLSNESACGSTPQVKEVKQGSCGIPSGVKQNVGNKFTAVSSKFEEVLGDLSELQRVSLKVTFLLFFAICFFLFALLPLAFSSQVLLEVFARIVSVIVFVAFFTFAVVGGLKGCKEEVVVFYDKKDAFSSFMMIGWSIVGSLLWWLTVGFSEAHESGFFASFKDYGGAVFVLFGCAYFTYKSILNFLYHNRGEDLWSLICGATTKLVAGVVYPLIVYNNFVKVNNLGKERSRGGSTAGQVIIATVLTFVSSWIVGRLVNGEGVYLKRGWTEEVNVDGDQLETD